MEFEALVNQHKDAVYRQILRVCGGSREDAEEVLIDALLRAWKHMDQLQDPAAFRSWLAKIGKRVCWHLRGREALFPVLQLSALEAGGAMVPSDSEPMEARLDAARMKAIVQAAVSSLPPDLAEVYRLRDLEGLSGEVTAHKLGLTQAGMKSRLHRARKQLRAELDKLLGAES